MASCGDSWGDPENTTLGIRPWRCDSVLKAHYVQQANLAIGRLEVQKMRVEENLLMEERSMAISTDERQVNPKP